MGFTEASFSQDLKAFYATSRPSQIWEAVRLALPPLREIVAQELAALRGSA